MLATLERKGFLKREEGIARSIRILHAGYAAIGKPPLIPVQGTSYGGALQETYGLLGEWRQLSPELPAMTDRCSFMRVSGNSRVGAGITHGCLVLVKEEREFTCNDIVFAKTPDGSTIKRFVTQDRPPYVSLRPDPDDGTYPVIACGPDTELVGRVIAVIRDGHPIINVNR
jgi:SOS-response transcriptional repressor LexA